MSTKRKPTSVEYERLSRSYADEPLTIDEVAGESAVGTTVLRKGRPVGDRKKGVTPVRSLRLPVDMEQRLIEIAKAEGVDASVAIRTAILEYIDRHSSDAG
jgi:hypothetical protein